MVDQVVIGFNDPHSAYHSADSIPPGGEDGIRVACSGGIGGGGSTPLCSLCSRTHYTLRTTYARVPQCSSVYASAPAARCIPQVNVTGIEPALYLVCKTLACCLSAHTLRFFSGWGIGDPVVGGRTPFAGLSASGSRGARPEPSFVSVITSLPRKQPTLLGSTCVATDTVRTSYLSSALVHFALLGGGVASLNGFSCAAIRSCGPVGEKAHEVFTSFPPHLGAKKAKPFNSASVQERYHDPAFHRIRFRSMNKSIPILG